MKKRVLSILLAAAMMLTLLPVTALADDGDDLTSAGLTEASVEQVAALANDLRSENYDFGRRMGGFTWDTEGKKRSWTYYNGIMMDAYLMLDYDEYFSNVNDFYNANVSSQGRVDTAGSSDNYYRENELDSMPPVRALFDLLRSGNISASQRRKYEELIWYVYDLMTRFETVPGTDGNFIYKMNNSNWSTYQVALDGLYMAQPFFMELAKAIEDGIFTIGEFTEPPSTYDLYSDVVSRMVWIGNNLYDESTGLYNHGWGPSAGVNGQFWLRAVGWYAAALADVISMLPEDFFAEREELIAIETRLFDGMLAYQDEETGMWYNVINYGPELNGSTSANKLESSGSALLAYAMLKSYSEGYVGRTYGKAGLRAFNGTVTNELYDGGLHDVYISSGVGTTPESYLTKEYKTNEAKGVGPLMMAACYAGAAAELYNQVYSVSTAVLPENGGSVTAEPASAAEDQIVTLSAVPATGYAFDGWTVLDEYGDVVEVTDDQFVMPGSNVTVTAAFSALSDWRQLQNLFEAGGTITLDRDYTDADNEGALVLPAGKTLTLDLSGHTIDRGLSNGSTKSKGYVIFVGSGATLSIADGTVTGGANSGAGGGIYVDAGGVLELSGVAVRGNRSTEHGAGIYLHGSASCTAVNSSVSDNQTTVGANGGGGGIYLTGGSLTMTNCSVSGNHARNLGGGLYIESGHAELTDCQINSNDAYANACGGGAFLSGGSLLLDGCEVIGNTSSKDNPHGIGVFVNVGARFMVSGDTTITNNKSGTKQLNVFLHNGAVIRPINLADTASIGVAVGKTNSSYIAEYRAGVITSGLTDNGSAANFTSDLGAYEVCLDAGGEAALALLYDVTVDPDIEHGSVTADKDPAQYIEGATVTLTVEADEGYVLSALTVKNGSVDVEVTEGENGAYTFTMPAHDVTVTASFAELPPAGPITITQQPADANAPLGEVVSTTVVAEGEGLQYQWYGIEPNGREFTSGLKGDTYSVKMVSSKIGRQVYCVITDAEGNTVTTRTATLGVEYPEDYSEPTVTLEPADCFAELGGAVSVTFEAAGYGELKYQWYFLNEGAEKWCRSSLKGDTYYCDMNAGRDGRQIYCVVTDAWGNTARTETVTIGYDYPEGYAPPSITLQPEDVFVDAGELAAASFEAEGEELTCQWYLRSSETASWSRSSLTGYTYSVTMIPAKSGRQVKCVVTDKYGKKAETEVVTLTMVIPDEYADGPQIAEQPADASAARNKVASTTVIAEGAGLTYQWYGMDPDGRTFRSSLKGDTYSLKMIPSKSGREVWCVITDKYGRSVASDRALLTMEP